MKQNLIIGFIGKDKPGLVRSIADVVNFHGGSWLESRMSQLADRFAGIAVVEVDAVKIAGVSSALAALADIKIWIEPSDAVTSAASETKNMRCLGLNIVGPDRPGILYDVTLALEQHVANVVELETNITAAPMSGALTFSADVVIEVPCTMDWSVIGEQLDEIASRLGVDILLEGDTLE